MLGLKNKTALITGASGGIGRAIAVRFAELGATVAVHYQGGEKRAKETLTLLKGTAHCTLQADLARPEQADNLANEALEQLGQLDILVNNAGVFDLHPLHALDFKAWTEAWQRTVAIDLLGPAYLSYAVARHMKKAGGGKIINISSRGAFRGEPDAPAYGAAKAGLNAMSQSLAKALAGDHIYVYAIAPCFVETEGVATFLNGPDGPSIRNQSPLGRVAKPEEVAHTAAFLAANGSEFLTGAIVDVNGASYLRS